MREQLAAISAQGRGLRFVFHRNLQRNYIGGGLLRSGNGTETNKGKGGYISLTPWAGGYAGPVQPKLQDGASFKVD